MGNIIIRANSLHIGAGFHLVVSERYTNHVAHRFYVERCAAVVALVPLALGLAHELILRLYPVAARTSPNKTTECVASARRCSHTEPGFQFDTFPWPGTGRKLSLQQRLPYHLGTARSYL